MFNLEGWRIMKKFLISTTALVAIVASSAFAEASTTPANGLTVTAGGIVDFQAGFRNQKKGYKVNLSTNNRNVAFMGHAKAYLAATARADMGFKYGGVIQLNTNVVNYSGNKDAKMEHTYVFVETGLGRVELGTNSSATQAMKVDAASIARATGGIGGDWNSYVNTTAYEGTSLDASYMVAPDFLSAYRYDSKWSSEKARKISYYTQRYNGVQFGISYTPDTGVVGKSYSGGVGGTLITDSGTQGAIKRDPRVIKNLISGGFNYTNQLDQVGFSVSLLGEIGKGVKNDLETDGKKYRNLRAWQVGAALDYAGFSVAGSYGVTNKKFANIIPTTETTKKHKDLNYWTAGLAYAQGPIGVSATYMNSNWAKNKFKNLVLGADYQLAPGLMPYVEAVFFEYKPKKGGTVVKKNRGESYIIGTELRF
ncbi:MAG: porin [Rickettsiales endosymbiont of Dermacentor nuttalli]